MKGYTQSLQHNPKKELIKYLFRPGFVKLMPVHYKHSISGIVYAIDFCNPTPDAGLESVGGDLP